MSASPLPALPPTNILSAVPSIPSDIVSKMLHPPLHLVPQKIFHLQPALPSPINHDSLLFLPFYLLPCILKTT